MTSCEGDEVVKKDVAKEVQAVKVLHKNLKKFPYIEETGNWERLRPWHLSLV